MNRRPAIGFAVAAWLMAVAAGAQQEGSDLVDLIQGGRLQEARERLARMESEGRDREQVLFLTGLLAANGDSAVAYYRRFLMLYPKSRFGDEAYFRIAQYYYTKGLYRPAQKHLLQALDRYPDSPVRDKCLYILGLSMLNLNRPDSATAYFRQAIDRNPDSEIAASARRSLASLGREVSGSGSVSAADSARIAAAADTAKAGGDAGRASMRYAVQVGAFASQNNAVLRKSFFERAGYPVKLRTKRKGNDLLYLVWIGTYATLEEAKKTGEALKSKYGLSYHIVTE